MHIDFDHCLLKVTEKWDDEHRETSNECRFHAAVTTNPDWWQNVDFHNNFDIDYVDYLIDIHIYYAFTHCRHHLVSIFCCHPHL